MDPNKRTRLFSTLGIVFVAGALVLVVVRMVGGFAGTVLGDRPGERWFGRESTQAERSIDEVDDGDGSSDDLVALEAGALAGFSAIAATGGWSIAVEQGEFDVAVEVSERVRDAVSVRVSGGTLRLDVHSGLRSVAGNLEATIRLPDLDRLEIDGGADIRLRGLELDRLDIDIDGAATINATGGSYRELRVETDGAANIDFSGSAVVDADVDMDGASNLNITMAGGELDGVLRGVGNVRYGGDVERESIRVEGLGRVHVR